MGGNLKGTKNRISMLFPPTPSMDWEGRKVDKKYSIVIKTGDFHM
jgi:hypothetical protein